MAFLPEPVCLVLIGSTPKQHATFALTTPKTPTSPSFRVHALTRGPILNRPTCAGPSRKVRMRVALSALRVGGSAGCPFPESPIQTPGTRQGPVIHRQHAACRCQVTGKIRFQEDQCTQSGPGATQSGCLAARQAILHPPKDGLALPEVGDLSDWQDWAGMLVDHPKSHVARQGAGPA